MDPLDEEVTNAVEAFLEDTWEDEMDDFFEAALEDEANSDSASLEFSSIALLEEEDVLPQGVPPPSEDHMKVLQNFFGHSSFRPMQWKIIHAVMQKQDNCVVMATGYGKSLCFQFPAVYQEGVVVVVSPLISLMQDQVLGLQALNISACFLGSGQTRKGEVYANVKQGVYRLVYVTPEFVEACIDFLKDLRKHVGIMMFAIDEAHCVSQWGHDFRSSYRKLGVIRTSFPGVPILAVTATATQRVQKDICSVLKLRNPVVTVTSFDRPNLYLEAKLKSNSILEDLLPVMVKDARGDYHPDGPTIVYCPTRKITEDVTFELQGAGVKCEMYHAGMSQKEREASHQKFVRDKVDIIVATVAFGMGINKPDVRRVIHYGAPGSPESYYQEIGRAGRDGLPSTCTVFYGPKDGSSYRYFIGQIKSEEFQKHQAAMLKKMSKFLNDTSCRRAGIISHFTSKLDEAPPQKGCCDNCTKKLQGENVNRGTSRVHAALNEEGEYDFTRDAKMILETVKKCSGCAAGSIVSILRGSKSSRVKPHWMKLPTYGRGKEKNEAFWKELVQMLVNSEWLTETLVRCGQGRGWGRGRGFGSTFSYSAIELSRKGENALSFPSVKIYLAPSVIMMDQLRYVVKRVVPYSDAPTTTGTTKGIFNPRDFLFTPASGMMGKSNLGPSTKQVKPPTVPGIATALRPVRAEAGQECQNEAEKEVSSKQAEKDDSEEQQLMMELYKSLLELRNAVADELNFMPYLVATNKTMLLLTQKRPTTLAALQTIEGMSEAKIVKFGPYFIGHIRSFCKENCLSCEEVGKDNEEYSSDNQDWSFKKTSFGWRFKRHSSALASVASSSGWLSKPRPQVDFSTSQPSPSDELDASEGKAAETRNANEKRVRETLLLSEIKEPETSLMVKEYHRTDSDYPVKDGNKSESDKNSECGKKNESKYTVPKLGEAVSNDEDFFDDLDDIGCTVPKLGEAVSNDDSFHDFEDIDFSEQLEVEDNYHEQKITEVVKEVNASHPPGPSCKPQVHVPTYRMQSSEKSKIKKGIQFSHSAEDIEENAVDKNVSGNKYEDILLKQKRELQGVWIDARKMKKKVKSKFTL